jgi:hypothetical protein
MAEYRFFKTLDDVPPEKMLTLDEHVTMLPLDEYWLMIRRIRTTRSCEEKAA